MTGLESAEGAASEDVVVRCDVSGAGAHDNDSEGEAGEREFVAAGAGESVLEVDLDDGDGHVDGDSESGQVGKQAEDEERASEKLGEGGDVAEPAGKAEVGDVLRELVEGSTVKDLFRAVDDHDDSQDEAGDER